MALQYSPKISTEGLVLCLDPGNNKSFPSYTLPVKGGLIMWMDASDDSTFSYSSGTTVSQWRDKSTSGYHMTPTSSGPTRSSVLNSRKVLSFTSTQDIRNLSIDLRTSEYTIFCVTRYSGGVPYRVLTSTTSTNWLLGHWSGYVNQYYAQGWIQYQGYATDSVWRIYMGDWSGASTDLANMYSNGTSLVSNSNQASIGPWTLGINAYTGELSECEAAEIIVFNRTLTAKERKQVHTYLGLKWGISNADRTIHDLTFNNDSKLGEGTSANMPRFDYYNGGALAFDGVNDYFYVNDGSGVPYFTPDGSTVSVNLWFKPATINTGASNKMIFSDNCSPEFSLHQVDNTVYAYSYYGVSATIQANKWYNACWTSNAGAANVTSSTTTVTFYLDGQLVGTNSGATGNGLNDLPFTLGKDPCVAGTNWSGSLGPIYFYNRIITAKEVKQNYEALKPRFFDTIVQSGLTLNLDASNPYSYAGVGTTWYDVSGNSNYSASLLNGTSYTSDNSGAFILDGVDDYIQTNLNQNTDNAQIAWECWFWDNSAGFGANLNTAIISNYGPSATTPFTLLHIYDNGYPFFAQRNSSGTESNATYSVNICDGIWHHLVGVVDGTNTLIYVDGVLRASQAKVTGTTTSGQNIVIGSNHLGRYQSCRIASARLYTKALSSSEVLQNYNATKGRYGR